jgi:hypothetical protein
MGRGYPLVPYTAHWALIRGAQQKLKCTIIWVAQDQLIYVVEQCERQGWAIIWGGQLELTRSAPMGNTWDETVSETP